MYYLTPIKLSVQVTHIVTVHYFEYSKDFQFSGESHDFWELLYVDKGMVEVYADETPYLLEQGQIIFHKPNEWHTVKAYGNKAPNLIVIAFKAKGPLLVHLEKLSADLNQTGQQWLSLILKEAHESYNSDLSDPDLKRLTKKKKAIPGCEQLLRNALESLLIHMIRFKLEPTPVLPQNAFQRTTENQNFERIIDYIHLHLTQRITLKDLSEQTMLSTASIERLVHARHQCGAIALVQQLRVEQAKLSIREGQQNFSELAGQLGFHSIHYFSRVFKKQTGMTLSEYAKLLR